MIDFNLQAIVRGAVDEAFAERVRHLPLKNGVADPSRAQTEFEAVVRVAGQRSKPLGEGWNLSVSTSKNTLWFDASRYPNLDIRARDRLLALDRDGHPAFEVIAIYPRGEMRIMLDLGNS